MSFISKNINLRWDREMISINQNVTIDFLLQNINKNWKWLSANPNISMKNIEENLKWNWDYLSRNPNITTDFVRNIDKNWDYKRLSDVEEKNM